MTRRAILASAICLVMALSPAVANASTTGNTSASGLKISPVRTDLVIDPGQNASVPVYVTNESDATVYLQAVVNDFTANGQSGVPALLFGQGNSSHGLKQFIAPIDNITLAPLKQIEVKVAINIPKGTPGGGYYSAVRFVPAPSSSSHNVTLSASVATLILVVVPGPGLTGRLSVAGFKVEKGSAIGKLFFGGSGLNAVVSFHNVGNVQEEPFGKISVTDLSGHTIETKQINQLEPPGSVLPSSMRSFSVPLSGIGSFGKYNVSGYFGYGSTGTLLYAHTSFYVIAPWIIALAVLVLIVLICAVWFTPKLIRRHYHKSQGNAAREG